MADKVRAIQDERYQLETEIQKLKTVVEEVKDKKTNAALSTKNYEHILDRMKKDEIRGQIRRN
jgi:septal ring factor EnvC (AmiA/AmiB activator)